MEYTILRAFGPLLLEDQVRVLIDRGWRPVGGLAVEPSDGRYEAMYSQAMTRTEADRLLRCGNHDNRP